MTYLLIAVCSLLSCAKVTIQGFLSRSNIKNSTDSVLANCIIFAFIAILFSFSLKGEIQAPVILYAALFGILGVSFQVFYSLSLQSGPFSTTCMLINLNMVVPVIFSIFFYDEKVTAAKGIGILLCLLALFLNVKSDGKKANARWMLYVFLAFLSTGGIGIVQKIFAKSPFGGNLEQFVFFGYLISFVCSWLLFGVMEKTKYTRTFKINKKTLCLAFFVAACLGAFQFFNTFANSFIDAIVLVPSICGLATIFQMVTGRILFREKFTAKQICSLCVGIAAILLISA